VVTRAISKGFRVRKAWCCGDEDVWEREQTREVVVLQDLT